MQTMEATTATTKVIYGVNELDLDLAGKTVRGIWKVLEQVLNIPRDAAVSVNGDRVEDDYVLRPGDGSRAWGPKDTSRTGVAEPGAPTVRRASAISRTAKGARSTCNRARSCASKATS